jgi:hypothetical protein
MLRADIAAVPRRREPLYATDVRAIKDVMLVHWAYDVDYPAAEILGVAPASGDVADDDLAARESRARVLKSACTVRVSKHLTRCKRPHNGKHALTT